MKKQGCILYKTMIMSLFVLLAVAIGNAQFAGPTVNVKIPFNFSIGAQKFAAGEYSLQPLLQHTVLLRNQSGQVLTNILWAKSVESSEAPSSTKLVFNRYRGQYFLAQLWEAGNGIGRELTRSPAEIEMAKATDSPGQQIALSFTPH
jgi:hypothetical protein